MLPWHGAGWSPQGAATPGLPPPSIPHRRRFLLKPTSPPPSAFLWELGGVTGSFSCCLFCPVRLLSPGSLLPFTRAPLSALLSLLGKGSARSAPPSPLAAPVLLFLVLTSCCCSPRGPPSVGALPVSPVPPAPLCTLLWSVQLELGSPKAFLQQLQLLQLVAGG